MYIRKPKLTLATRIENFFECLFCEYKKDCPVSFGNRITIHYSMPGEYSSDFYHKNLCKKENRPYKYSIYRERVGTILLISACLLLLLFMVMAIASIITENKILFVCMVICGVVCMILTEIWYHITK